MERKTRQQNPQPVLPSDKTMQEEDESDSGSGEEESESESESSHGEDGSGAQEEPKNPKRKESGGDGREVETPAGPGRKPAAPAGGKTHAVPALAAAPSPVSGSDTESASDEDVPRTIAKIVASDRKASSALISLRKSAPLVASQANHHAAKRGRYGRKDEDDSDSDSDSDDDDDDDDDGDDDDDDCDDDDDDDDDDDGNDDDASSRKRQKEDAHGASPDKANHNGLKVQDRAASPEQEDKSAVKLRRKQAAQAQNDGQTEDQPFSRSREMRSRGKVLQKAVMAVEKKAEKKGARKDPETDKKIKQQEEHAPSMSSKQKSHALTPRKQKNPAAWTSNEDSETDKKSRPQREHTVAEMASLQKQKKPSIWAPSDEITLALGLMHRVKAGLDFPPKKGDDYWVKLGDELEGSWSRDQLYEKIRRMKSRYHVIADRIKVDDSKPGQFKNVHEESLFKIWKRTWGAGDVWESEDGEPEEGGRASKRAARVRVSSEAARSRRKEEEPETPGDEHEGKKAEDAACGHGTVLTPPSAAAESSPSGNGCSMNAFVSDALDRMQNANKAFLEELQTSCQKALEELRANAILTVQSSSKATGHGLCSYNWMPSSPVSSFVMPPADCLSMARPSVTGLGDDKLKSKWREQNLQELKVFTQRLQLMQEECRVQQEQLEAQLKPGSL